MRSVISGLSDVARGALWILVVLAVFFGCDALLFRTGWYNQYLEPQSSAGSLESHLYWLEHAMPRVPSEVLVVGDSRVAEGFSSRTATVATQRRLHFWNFGVAGTTPRVWYYTLRDADPTRRRFAAIVLALDNYSDADWFAEFEDRATDRQYLALRLGLGDCIGFAFSNRDPAARSKALFGCLFRGVTLRQDVQGFLADPAVRMKNAADRLQNGLGYDSGYSGKPESLQGMSVDWQNRTIHFPDTVPAATRANVERFVLLEPTPQTGALARYRKRWLGAILDLYQDSPTRLIFLQLPRGPLVDPSVKSSAVRFVDSVPSRVRVLPDSAFSDLERPDLFADGLHLNSSGRPIFSERLAAQVEAVISGQGRGR